MISDPFDVRIVIDKKAGADTGAIDALKAAIEDLCSGRLSLGARSSGWFDDKVTLAKLESATEEAQ